MRRSLLLTGLLAAALVNCQTYDEPTAVSDPLPPSSLAGSRSFAAAVSRIDVPFFQLRNPDTDRSLTLGLVSPVSELADCGGTGTPVFDGNGTHKEVQTPAGPVHFFDRIRQGTIVLYEGAPEDVCELAAAPVLARGRGNFAATFHVLGTKTLISFRIVGIVELADGGRAHMLEIAKVVIDENGDLTVRVERSELKPIGG
jgi:hypothetical protein